MNRESRTLRVSGSCPMLQTTVDTLLDASSNLGVEAEGLRVRLEGDAESVSDGFECFLIPWRSLCRGGIFRYEDDGHEAVLARWRQQVSSPPEVSGVLMELQRFLRSCFEEVRRLLGKPWPLGESEKEEWSRKSALACAERVAEVPHRDVEKDSRLLMGRWVAQEPPTLSMSRAEREPERRQFLENLDGKRRRFWQKMAVLHEDRPSCREWLCGDEWKLLAAHWMKGRILGWERRTLAAISTRLFVPDWESYPGELARLLSFLGFGFELSETAYRDCSRLQQTLERALTRDIFPSEDVQAQSQQIRAQWEQTLSTTPFLRAILLGLIALRAEGESVVVSMPDDLFSDDFLRRLFGMPRPHLREVQVPEVMEGDDPQISSRSLQWGPREAGRLWKRYLDFQP